MKLNLIKFNCYKTIIADFLEIEKNITCLVGINEAGKSNVLLGIEKIDKDKELINDDTSRHSKHYLEEGFNPVLEFTLASFNSEEEDKLKLAFGVNTIKEIKIAKEGGKYRIDYPSINYEKSNFFQKPEETQEKNIDEVQEPQKANNSNQNGEISEDVKLKIRQEIESLVISLLPRFYYFDSVDFDQYFLPLEGDISIQELIKNPDKYTPVINLLKLAEIDSKDLTHYATPQERIKRTTRLESGTDTANEKLLRAFWPTDTVLIKLAAEGDILKIRIKEDREFLPGERSRGLQWALAFNIFFLASTNEKLKDSLLLIDEPGIFLHIDGQRKMISTTFPEISKSGNQIIYTTHLPYLIDKNFPERIRILEKQKEDTKIGNKAWSSSEFGSIPEPVRTALGLNIEEAFLFGGLNLVVEGPVDHIYLRLILEKFDSDFLNKITIVPAYGVTKVPKVMILSQMSNYVSYGLIDADKDITVIKEQFTKVGINDPQIDNIANISENQTVKTIEDIMPASIMQEACFRVYKKECNKRKRNLDKGDIPVSVPRQFELENYFRTKLTSPKHKLLKMEIARSAKDILEENFNISTNDWNQAKKLVKGIKQFIGGKKKI